MINHYNDLSKKAQKLSTISVDIPAGQSKDLKTIQGILFFAGVAGDNRCHCLYIVLAGWNAASALKVITLDETNCSMKFYQYTSLDSTCTITATGINNTSTGFASFFIQQIK